MTGKRIVKAPTGNTLNCKGWLQEAAYRMIQNNLDPSVAEHPEELIVYGGIGKAARNWESFDKILFALKNLENDETLIVQSGKPIGIVRTHSDAPRVLIANSNLVPKWATWDHFHELDKKGLMMFGQMTAGSWIYIGTQGIVQGTYETFVEAGRQHFNGDLSGRVILTAGLGGMGGAQPLAGVFAGAIVLGVEVDPTRIQKRLETKYVDEVATDLQDALARVKKYKETKQAKSIALCGNMATVIHQLLDLNFLPDILTDQTSAHDPLVGYIPEGLSLPEADALRVSNEKVYLERAYQSMAKHVRGMLEMKKRGAVTFDYGNNLRARAQEAGVKDAFDFPGFVPAYIRPLFCKGSGPFRWVALSGDPNDIKVTDEALKNLFPHKTHLHRWIDMARERIAYQGLPARICWLEYGERAKAGLLFNQLVKEGKVSAPLVIGRDHLDCGSVASPNRETEAMKDGSDAVSDWPLLNAMGNVACGSTWVSLHHGGGVGMGYSQHSGQVIVADGTPEAARRLERVLTFDPAMGVFRHVDAGYEDAKETALERGVKSLLALIKSSHLIIAVPILLSFMAAVPAFIAIMTDDQEQHVKERKIEAKALLESLVDSVLAQDKLELDIVKVGFRPEGKIKNVYGFLKSCHPQFENLNLVRVKELQSPVPLFKFDKMLAANSQDLLNFFESSACENKEVIKAYALFVNSKSEVEGWTMTLQKEFNEFKAGSDRP